LINAGMSLRNVNTLEEAGIFTVVDLVALSGEQVRAVENFGDRAYEEAEQVVSRLGVYPKSWGMNPPKGSKRLR
jgi:DNA-directed RNA polymerase alpha subunit